MEGTGIPNRIHVSEATADLLIAAGKGHWVQTREDMIEAKGKVRMQTYFVTPEAGIGAEISSAQEHYGEIDSSSGGSCKSQTTKLQSDLPSGNNSISPEDSKGRTCKTILWV